MIYNEDGLTILDVLNASIHHAHPHSPIHPYSRGCRSYAIYGCRTNFGGPKSRTQNGSWSTLGTVRSSNFTRGSSGQARHISETMPVEKNQKTPKKMSPSWLTRRIRGRMPTVWKLDFEDIICMIGSRNPGVTEDNAAEWRSTHRRAQGSSAQEPSLTAFDGAAFAVDYMCSSPDLEIGTDRFVSKSGLNDEALPEDVRFVSGHRWLAYYAHILDIFERFFTKYSDLACYLRLTVSRLKPSFHFPPCAQTCRMAGDNRS
ncbi:hypothetical protein FA13DRAFT_1731759 [Coprinellus micaceus]|uniref:Uncharacterized protein n=1 Tax=Coprinellus micaceus TaxID=71717 RepID=A0A4Y7TF36_COPMI|nr:hypothetical protein FA13DRAFT_1731759 [Coprinellus micaceus]